MRIWSNMKISCRISIFACLTFVMLTSCWKWKQTPIGTAVNLATLKGYYTGTADTGSQLSFSIAGHDNKGNAWHGTFKLVSEGTKSYEGKNVNRSSEIISVKTDSTGNAISTTTTNYFLATDSSFYKSVKSTGVTGTPANKQILPDIIHVGKSGTFLEINYSDKTKETIIWKLVGGINGNSKLLIASVTMHGSNLLYSENKTFHLDAAGNPKEVDIEILLKDKTISMAGSL